MKYLILISIIILSNCSSIRTYLDKKHTDQCIKCLEEYLQTPISKDSTIIVKVDTFNQYIETHFHDTTTIRLGCDSLGNVVLLNINKLNSQQKVISNYQLKNNVLIAVNESYRDSVKVLKETIEKSKNSIKIVEKQVIVEKTPIWVYISLGIIVLFTIFSIYAFRVIGKTINN